MCVWPILVSPGCCRVRSVLSCTPSVSSGTFGCIRSIAMHPGSCMVRSGAFRPFSAASRAPWRLSVSFWCVPFASWGCKFVSGGLGTFPCALGVVGFVRSIPVRLGGLRVRSLHSSTPWESLKFVWSIPVRPVFRRGRSGAFAPFLYAQEVARVRSVHSRSRLGSKGAFGPFSCALGVIGLVRVRSLHSRACCGSFGCFRPIHVCPGCRRVRSVHFRVP